MQIRPFEVAVTEACLADLRERLGRTRWPQLVDEHDWTEGIDLVFLKRLCEYWRTQFDWRAQEARINGWPNFLCNIDGVDIHFIHQKAESGPGYPLLLVHGWPGSMTEYLDLIGPLSAPARHGSSAFAFDVVVVSIPGFGFGGKPTQPGWGKDRVAAAFNTLMTTVLGYSRYGIQGGDWGAILGRRMSQNHSDHVEALHINMPYALPGTGATIPAQWTEIHARETAYLHLQLTKPYALALGHSDSPMGLANWILDKFAAWGDCRNGLESAFTLDKLLTNLMFYWAPNSAASSSRIYLESARETVQAFGGERVQVPTAVAAFANEPFQAPRRWVEQTYNVRRWIDYPSGGHFPGLEKPAELLADMRAWFTGFAR